MNPGGYRYVYGPVPSRRLGRSLGVDLVPLKTCSYDCLYCQLGRTTRKTVERGEYVPAARILEELDRKLAEGDSPDTISLAGSGEPTLNSGIGSLIRGIRERTEIPVAVLTNGSLLWMEEVREDLMPADRVLPSLDAGDEALFRYVNRPHKDISFGRMVDGIAAFAGSFPGEVWLEVFLLAGVTGLPSEAKKIADAARRIAPARIQLNTVSRPPAEEYAYAVSGKRLEALKGLFPGIVDVLNESGGEEFRTSFLSGVREEDILGLLGRRPCTFQDVAGGLGIHGTEAIKRLEALTAAGKVKTALAGGRTFYSVAERKRVPGT